MPVDGCITFFCGSRLEVVMLQRVHKEFQKLETKPRATLERHMKSLGNGNDLLDTQFKFEARLPVGNGDEIAVWAVKAFKARIYGCYATGHEQRRFICTEIDGNKKQDAADQEKLKRAARNMMPFCAKKGKQP